MTATPSLNFVVGLAVCCVLRLDAAHSADDWNQFRGPNGSGVVDADVPTVWSETKNLKWKRVLPARGSSSPVVYRDRIYLTGYSGYGESIEDPGDRADLKLHVLCIAMETGEVLWDCPIDPDPSEQPIAKRVAEHGYASPTACVDDSGVYAFFGPSGLVGVSLEGDLLWQRNLGTDTAGFGAAASPILFGDLVIMNASIEGGSAYGINKLSGEVVWQADEILRAWTTPTVIQTEVGKAELVLNQKDAILGLDPSTGERLWRCDAIEDYIVPRVVADGSMLYCSGGRSNKTFVVRAGGRGDLSESHLVWDVSRGANVTTPVLVNDHLYWSHDKAIALCLRSSDGEEMFRERMPTRSRVYASIVSDGKHLFLTTRDEGVLVLAAKPAYEEIGVNRLGTPDERFNATPAIANNLLLLRSDTTLYCVGR
ncbi:MAG: PQQ-binding-like beta-propeller repeat protein [Planctomycetota bacterium]